MKEIYQIILALFIVGYVANMNHICASNSAVTYNFNGGRFADRLKSCIMALWLAYKYDLKFLFKPFNRSEFLNIYYLCEHYSDAAKNEFECEKIFNKDDALILDQSSCLYTTTFYVDTEVDWHYKEYIKKYISPRGDWAYMTLPDNKNTIALHIRRGGKEDERNRRDLYETRKQRAAQFPSLDYYVQALHIMLQRIKGKCYVHIFTDDQNPGALARTLYSALTQAEKNRVTLDWHNPPSSYTQDPVLQDFFDMMQFEYLIKPRSNFSKYARLLGYHKIVIEPETAIAGNPWGIVTSLRILTQDHAQVTVIKEVLQLSDSNS